MEEAAADPPLAPFVRQIGSTGDGMELSSLVRSRTRLLRRLLPSGRTDRPAVPYRTAPGSLQRESSITPPGEKMAGGRTDDGVDDIHPPPCRRER
jgi:hypothetical protein